VSEGRALRTLRTDAGALGEWKPQDAAKRDGLIQALKDAARAVKDWDLLDQAVDQEVSDQRCLVEWWGEHVSVRESPGRSGHKSSLDRGTISLENAEDISGIANQKVSKWRKALNGDLDEYRYLLRGPSWRKAMGERGSSDQKGASGTGENEWFTPPEYIDAARQVMGDIDLDPATSLLAQETIAARTFYTKADNGLIKEWRGRIWLNPPYAQPWIADFISKLVAERKAERVTEAVTLTHNYTDTAWFHDLASVASAICFTRGRVKFYDGVRIAAPTQGQAFAYLGENVARFAEIFRPIGFVAYLVDPPQ
jgi:phage N-6-adenine-methyltransferase